MCLDSGYVGAQSVVEEMGYMAHIRGRGEEKKVYEKNPQSSKRAGGLLNVAILGLIVSGNCLFVTKKRLAII